MRRCAWRALCAFAVQSGAFCASCVSRMHVFKVGSIYGKVNQRGNAEEGRRKRARRQRAMVKVETNTATCPISGIPGPSLRTEPPESYGACIAHSNIYIYINGRKDTRVHADEHAGADYVFPPFSASMVVRCRQIMIIRWGQTFCDKLLE